LKQYPEEPLANETTGVSQQGIVELKGTTHDKQKYVNAMGPRGVIGISRRLRHRTEPQGQMKTSVQLQSTNAQTPGKTEEHQRPESKTNQHDREPSEICKTSIPGSNPGGCAYRKGSI